MPHVAQNFNDMSGSKTQVFVVFTPAPSILQRCCHTVTVFVLTVEFPSRRTRLKVALCVGNGCRLCILLTHLSSAMKAICNSVQLKCRLLHARCLSLVLQLFTMFCVRIFSDNKLCWGNIITRTRKPSMIQLFNLVQTYIFSQRNP